MTGSRVVRSVESRPVETGSKPSITSMKETEPSKEASSVSPGAAGALERVVAVVAFVGAFVANYYAGHYVDRMGARSPSLGEDLLLYALPRFDLTVVFVWGFAAFLAWAAASAFIWERDRIPYIMWMYAMLILLRSFFLTLTPMGMPAGAYEIEGYALVDAIGRYITFKHDLFFSAHTSMPFLGFLIYHRLQTRYVFMALSVVLAVCVLVCRFHYSVDVIGAYFITYGFVALHEKQFEPRYRMWKNRLFQHL